MPNIGKSMKIATISGHNISDILVENQANVLEMPLNSKQIAWNLLRELRRKKAKEEKQNSIISKKEPTYK